MAKRTETEENLLCIFLAVGALIFVAFVLFVMIDAPKEENRKANFLQQRQCKVVGFYGQSGSYKVYDCMGVLIKEKDL